MTAALLPLALLAGALQAASYKLVIVANDSAVAIDYPNKERCENAAKAAENEARRRVEAQAAKSADPIIRPALRIMAFCLPG